MISAAAHHSALTRRRLLAFSAALGAGLLTGCNSTAVDARTGPPEEAGGFPVTVRHTYGSTIVPAAPQRILSVGLTEQDPLFALGLSPVAVTEWYDERPNAIWPWAVQAAAGAEPPVLAKTDGRPWEEIGTYTPDLIVAVNAGLSAEEYERMSAIAPTIAHSGEFDFDYFQPWPVQTELIGQGVGKPTEAATMITTLKERFAAEAAAHPVFADHTAVFLQAPFYEGRAIAYQDGLSTAFLTDLGFTVPTEIDQYAEDGNQAYIPLEKLDVLNSADVLIWATSTEADEAELRRSELFNRLRAVRQGRSFYTGSDLSGAIYFATVLSLPYVLDRLVPTLAKALRD